jgi:hypothetical protein
MTRSESSPRESKLVVWVFCGERCSEWQGRQNQCVGFESFNGLSTLGEEGEKLERLEDVEPSLHSSVGIGRERFEYRAAKASIVRSTICKANCSATGKDK